MKALQYAAYGDPEALHLVDAPVPIPGAGEVLIRLQASPVGPGDCKLRAGLLRRHFDVAFPKIPGRYGAGLIVEAGAGVADVRPGDEVVFAKSHKESGSAAEFVVCGRAGFAPKPPGLDAIEAAAMIHGGVCAWTCLHSTAGLRRGEAVLVHGAAGAVGSASVELAVHLGANVTATCREEDRSFVRGLGAERVIAYDREEFSRVVSDMDVVLDPLGGDVHRRSYGVLKRGGRLVYLVADPIEDRGAEHGVAVIRARIEDTRAVLEKVLSLADQGVFKPRVARVLPLRDGAAAHRLVETGGARQGRVVLGVN